MQVENKQTKTEFRLKYTLECMCIYTCKIYMYLNSNGVNLLLKKVACNLYGFFNLTQYYIILMYYKYTVDTRGS